jgi:predicted nucleotidyltransferase component of viral defense system
MISKRSFTLEWVRAVNDKLGWKRGDNQLRNVEKAIAAMELVESLSKAGIDFIWKGGTSLLLLLGDIRRLSIDIDIVAENPISDSGQYAQVCEASNLFTRFEKQTRSSLHSDTDHYMFFYPSFVDGGKESYILLDVYNAASPYAKTVDLELNSDLLHSNGANARITLPTIDSILGDKLTAFAPETTGIALTAEPGHRPKRVEAIKQLYDVGNLFDRIENVLDTLSTYFEVAKREIQIRDLQIVPEEALRDTLNYAIIIGHGGAVEKDKYDLISKGYNDFRKFVADLSFDTDNAVLAASKTAYLATLLLSKSSTVEKYDAGVDMQTWSIGDDRYDAFNEYLFSNPEAFFYWYKTLSGYTRPT